MIKIINFKTEYITNPICIDNKKPRFSWGYELGSKVVSYQLTVYTKMGLSDNLEVWNSGIVYSTQTIGIEYDGAELKSHTKYYVKLRVDGENEFDEIVETFETALFDKCDWQGRWVSIPVNFNGGTLLFRKIMEVPEGKKIVRARAYICGIGYHELFVDGKKIGNSKLNPSVTDYEKRAEYVVYDLGDINNKFVLGIELGYGWLGDRKLLCQIYIELDDGSYYEDHSGPGYGWWVGGSPTIDNGIYSGEVYDATIEEKYPLNWCTFDYEPTWANGWMYTINCASPKCELVSQKINPIKVCGEFKEVSRKDMGNNIFVLDMGVNLAGWLKITVQGERGTRVTLKYGEQLTDNGYVNQLNLRSARCSDTYVLRGEGVEEFAPRFTYHGFQYVQVEIVGNAKLITAVAEHVHSDTELVGYFECDDEILNKLHFNAVLTEHNNEHSILTDCPQRDERFGWLNDLGSRIYQTMYNVDLSRFIPKFIQDIADGQQEKGEICDTAPYYTGGIPADPVCVIFPLLASYAYRYYGDINTAKTQYSSIKKWVDFLLSKSKEYIMEYSYYGDWVLPFPETIVPDNIYVSTFYLLWHLKEMTNLAKITGNKEDEIKYDRMVKESIASINTKYFNKETFNYSRGTQTENALAVSLGVCEKENCQKVVDNIYNDVIKNNHHCTSGNIGYRHVFYVLGEYGYGEEVINILKNPEYPGWGFMIEKGAASVWERWEYTMTNIMHSFNHPMFGSYDAFLYKFLGGIGIDENSVGADKVTIKPYFINGINKVNSSYKSIRGLITSSWYREGNKVVLTINIPSQTDAKLIVNEKEIKLNEGENNFII